MNLPNPSSQCHVQCWVTNMNAEVDQRVCGAFARSGTKQYNISRSTSVSKATKECLRLRHSSSFWTSLAVIFKRFRLLRRPVMNLRLSDGNIPWLISRDLTGWNDLANHQYSLDEGSERRIPQRRPAFYQVVFHSDFRCLRTRLQVETRSDVIEKVFGLILWRLLPVDITFGTPQNSDQGQWEEAEIGLFPVPCE